MTDTQTISRSEFMQGWCTALVVLGTRRLVDRSSHPLLHRAFKKALDATTVPAFRELAREVDYDPLYSVSRWLVQGIAEASRDLFLEHRRFWIEILFEQEEAKRVLEELGLREEFLAFARAFLAKLEELKHPAVAAG